MNKHKSEIIYDVLYHWYTASSKFHNISIGFEICGKNLYIYTSYPGILIGQAGKNVELLYKMLKEHNIKMKIHFVEIGYDWPKQIKVKRRWF